MSPESEIRAAATRFRQALEIGGLAAPAFERFPHGSCAHASHLLGQYLGDCGYGRWTYRAGVIVDQFRSHGWIEQDGLLVDITADQYAEVEQPVIVTYSSDWHRQWPRGSSNTADLQAYNHQFDQDYLHDYTVLKARADSLRGNDSPGSS